MCIRDRITVTGRKLDQKIYYQHSAYVGGMKETTLKDKLNTKPVEVIEHAVKGMLPKGPLGREMYKKLYVYAGPELSLIHIFCSRTFGKRLRNYTG